MPQSNITAVMAQLVVELLEVIQIRHGHTDGCTLTTAALALTAEQHLVLAAVEQPSQRIGSRLALELLFQQLAPLHLLLQRPVGNLYLVEHGKLLALHGM